MTVADIANDLVAKVTAGDYLGAMNTHYHPKIVSIEPVGEPRQVTGLEACHQKAQWWLETFEVHGTTVEGPFVGTEQFAVRYLYDVTNKAANQRFVFDEMALYWVVGDKIVKEQFFYQMAGV
jgi:hypothetical protein